MRNIALNMMINAMNSTEKRNFQILAEVILRPKKMRVRPDFRYVMCEAFPDEGLNDPEHDTFFSRYAGRKVIVINQRDDKDYFILQDNNYALTKDCFY